MEMHALLYYRSRLSTDDQQAYDKLVAGWMQLREHVSFPTPECGLDALTDAVHKDYPLLFYVDYYKMRYIQFPSMLRLNSRYLHSREEAKQYLEDCKAWGEYIIRQLPANLQPKEKALWLHDVILNNVRYGKSNGFRAHNLVGVVKDGEAVCEGISMAYKYLCDLAGIPCIVVFGTLTGGPHAWNLLWIEGGCSFVDVTNDINSGKEFGRNNFLRSSDQMDGYEWDHEEIPECRLSNRSNDFLVATSRAELFRQVRKASGRDSLSIQLDFGRELSAAEIQSLMQASSLICPSLIFRKMSYSPDRQIIFIE